MSETGKRVECREHGSAYESFVCSHLISGEGLGFHFGHSEEEPDALYPDAWCDACEKARVEAGGWNESSEASADINRVVKNAGKATTDV